MGLWNIVLDFLFPARCLRCRAEGAYLCRKCATTLPSAEPPEDEWIHAVFSYQHKLARRAVWLLKYRGRTDLARTLGSLLAERLAEELAELETMENFRAPILVPVPISSRRRRERGFNQAELLARVVATELKKEYCPALEKIRETEPQAKIKTRDARLKNLKDCFVVKNPESVRGRNVVIIDDVTTTGATAREARRALRQAGAKKIIACALAH